MRASGVWLASTFTVFAFAGACGSATDSGGNNAGAGNSAATGNGGTGGVDLEGGSGSGGTLQGCATESHTGELVPVDMFVMLDQSASMTQGTDKWGQVTGAIQQFVNLPNLDKLGMGIAFFPTKPADPPPTGPCTFPQPCGFYECVPIFNACGGFVAPNDSCVATDYQTPVVGIADLPGVGAQIKAAMAGQTPAGDITPIAPALEGAIDYATQWAQAHTDRVTVAVLATDGEPTGCVPNGVSDAAAHAAEGLAQIPSVKTFVIGVGDLSALDQIAQAGGTDKVIPVSTGNAGADFLKALDEIRGAVSCQYLLPTSTAGNVDPTKVNLGWTPDGQPDQQIIPHVENAGDCQGQVAWYYDNPNDPKQILLCPATCDLVSNSKGTLDVVFGCKTQPVP